MPLGRRRAQVISVRYDPESLARVRVTSIFADAEPYIAAAKEEDRLFTVGQGVIESLPGLIRIWWMPGNYVLDDKTEKESWKEYIEHKFWAPYRAIMDALYELHFSDEA